MDLEQLALKPKHFFMDAIRRHQEGNYMQLPKRFEVHPEVVGTLIREYQPSDREITIDVDGVHIVGVLIKEVCPCPRPKMITCINQIEYL
jgi:hypothetical protein